MVLEHFLKSSEDCSDCGGKTMNKLSKIISYCIFGICATVCSSNCYATNFSDFVKAVAPADNTNQPNEKAESKLTPERQNFIRDLIHAMIDEDIESFYQDESASVFSDYLQKTYGYKPVTAEQMFSTYDKNQIKGDKEYINQKLLVSGKIEQIKSSVGNKPVIFMKAGKNALISTVNAAFKNPDGDIDKIVNLEKGQKIVLLCTGGGVVLNSPFLNDCEFASDYVDSFKEYFDNYEHSFINGNPKGEGLPLVFFTIGYFLSLEECNENNCKVDKKVKEKMTKAIGVIQLNKEQYSKLKPKDRAVTDKYKKEVWNLLADRKIVDPNTGALLVDDFELIFW